MDVLIQDIEFKHHDSETIKVYLKAELSGTCSGPIDGYIGTIKKTKLEYFYIKNDIPYYTSDVHNKDEKISVLVKDLLINIFKSPLITFKLIETNGNAHYSNSSCLFTTERQIINFSEVLIMLFKNPDHPYNTHFATNNALGKGTKAQISFYPHEDFPNVKMEPIHSDYSDELSIKIIDYFFKLGHCNLHIPEELKETLSATLGDLFNN